LLTLLLIIPLELRLAGCFVIGLAIGAAVNWGIHALAWNARPISPWSPKHVTAPPRRWHDFLPVIGWLSLRREAPLHGRAFWIRPLLLELFCGLGLAALYGWETAGQLVPVWARGALTLLPAAIHAQFFVHVVLISLMLVATFIDFDEQTIPDSITVPGTLLALLLAAAWPFSHLPEALPGPPPAVANLLLTSPAPWFPKLDGWRYLALGCLIIAVWSFSLMPATTTLRYGWTKGVIYYAASIFRDFYDSGARKRRRDHPIFYAASIRREFHWPRYALLAVVPMGVTAFVWGLGGPRWESLLTALVGLAFGGGLVWGVRVVGRISLKREAMGFGDVTLMCMIGAFLGWQAALMVFFLSPAAALVIAVTQYLLTRRKDIAFGPYLCLAALFLIVAWASVWDFAKVYFELGMMIPVLVGACLLMMMGMLMFWRMIRELVFPE
jgi:leader peptidase (prepilin peptidase) / N-methyltransferase